MPSSEAGRRSEKYATSGRVSASAARSIRSASSPLLNWWLMSTPKCVRLPKEAERSFAIATAASPFAAAVSSAAHDTMAVTGTCPLSAPAALSRRSSGSSRRWATSRGSPATAAVRSIGTALPTENSVMSAPARRATSIATTESLPPPTGTSSPAGAVRPVAGAAVPTGNAGRGSSSSPLRNANSPRPSE